MKQVIKNLYTLKGAEAGERTQELRILLGIGSSGSGYEMSDAVTTGMAISGATTNGVYVTGSATSAFRTGTGTFTNGVLLGGTLTTGVSIGAATTGVAVTGATTTGVSVSGASTTALSVSGNATTGLAIGTGTIGTGISLGGTLTTGLTVGACTTALNVSGATTTGLSISGATTNAISIPPTAATTCAILIGTGISAGMPMSGTKNGLIRAFGEIQASGALTNDIRGIWGRVRVNAGCDVSGGYQICGVQGSTKLYGTSAATTTTLWMHSGVYGSFETDDVEYTNVATGGTVAGIVGVFGGGTGFTIDSGGIGAAVCAFGNTKTGATATGTFAGVYVTKGAGTKSFTNAIQVADSVATTGITIGTVTTGIVIGAATTGLNLSGTVTSGINVAGTATQVINVAAAANVTNFATFNAAAGCILNVDVNPKDVPSAGGLGADACLRLSVAGNDYFIPLFMTELS